MAKKIEKPAVPEEEGVEEAVSEETESGEPETRVTVEEARAMAEAGDEFRSHAAFLKQKHKLDDEAHDRATELEREYEERWRAQREAQYEETERNEEIRDWGELAKVAEEQAKAKNELDREFAEKRAALIDDLGRKYFEMVKPYYGEPTVGGKPVTIEQEGEWLVENNTKRRPERYEEDFLERREAEIEKALKQAEHVESVAQAVHRHPEVKGLNGEPITVQEVLNNIKKRWNYREARNLLEKSADIAQAKGGFHRLGNIFYNNYGVRTEIADRVAGLDPSKSYEIVDELVNKYNELADKDETTIAELRAFTGSALRKYADIAKERIEAIDAKIGPILEERKKEEAKQAGETGEAEEE